MKKIYLFLFGAFCLLAFNTQAQVNETVLANFEDGGIIPTITASYADFIDANEIIANPEVVTLNQSEKVLHISTSGTSSGSNEYKCGFWIIFNTPFTVDANHRYLHLAIKSNLSKLETSFPNNNQDPNTSNWASDTNESWNPGGDSQWKTNWNATNSTSWIDKIVDLNTLNGKLLKYMRINIESNQTGNQNKEMYIDEIVVSNSNTARPIIPTPPPTRISDYTPGLPLISNWETPGIGHTSVSLNGSTIDAYEIVSNTTTDIQNGNSTANSYHISTNGATGNWDNGLNINFKQSFQVNNSDRRYLHIFMKTNAARFEIMLNGNTEVPHTDPTGTAEYKFDNGKQGNANLNNRVYTNFNGGNFDLWFDYVIDLNQFIGTNTLSSIRFCPRNDMTTAWEFTNWNCEYVDCENFSRNKEFYIDEIIVDGSSTPRSSIVSGQWTGLVSSDWNESKNWSDYVPPFYSTDIIIPAGLSTYPVLNEDNPYSLNDEITYNDCNTITLEAGAKLGNQHLLIVQTENGATVNYSLPKGQWNMITTPVDATVQDFHFGHTPETWLQRFGLEYGANEQWNYILDLNHALETGDGFALYVDGAGTQNFNLSGALAGTSVTKMLSFGNDGNYDFALVGNPFMTTIDFSAIASSAIYNSYLIFTNGGYAGYNSATGHFGVANSLTQYIAPLQSFIVEKNADGDLVFNSSIQATNAPEAGLLLAPANISNKLNITAENSVASVIATIAQRESGDASHKLFDDLSATPDIYTLQSDEKFGVQLIQTDNQIIPIGLRTNYNGNMSFTFTGMDNYDAAITFTDATAGAVIDLTNLESYTYEFDYTPLTANEENRFAIQLAPKTITGIRDVSTGRVVATQYYNLQGVQIPVGALRATPLQPGIYIVKTVYASGKSEVSKIIIK